MSSSTDWERESAAGLEGVRGFWRRVLKGDTFGFLFLVLLLNFAVSVTAGHSVAGRLLVGMLSGATPLVALLAARAPRRWIHIAVAILMTAVFGSVVEASLTEPNGSPVAVALLAAVLLCCIPITLLRLLEHETVTGETVAGSLCVYLLLGMAFANVYMAVGLMGGQIIIGTVPTVGAIERADYFYFSFISMLTVGFGDIVPVGRAGQALVVLQAITGQVVLLTLVARMVNVARVRRRPSRRSATGASHAEADVPAAGQTEGGKAH